MTFVPQLPGVRCVIMDPASLDTKHSAGQGAAAVTLDHFIYNSDVFLFTKYANHFLKTVALHHQIHQSVQQQVSSELFTMLV